MTTNDGKRAVADLNARVGPKQKEFEARRKDLERIQDQLTNGSNLLNGDQKAQLSQELESKRKKLERDVQDAQEEVRNRQQGVLEELGKKLTLAIKQYARDNKLSLVLESGADSPVIYAADAIDITAPVVALYDQSHEASGR